MVLFSDSVAALGAVSVADPTTMSVSVVVDVAFCRSMRLLFEWQNQKSRVDWDASAADDYCGHIVRSVEVSTISQRQFHDGLVIALPWLMMETD